MAKTAGKIKIGGREVPLTKNGVPNLVHLSKEEREVVKKHLDKKKKEKKEIQIKELTDILNKLG
jgi:hypothetical protein